MGTSLKSSNPSLFRKIRCPVLTRWLMRDTPSILVEPWRAWRLIFMLMAKLFWKRFTRNPVTPKNVMSLWFFFERKGQKTSTHTYFVLPSVIPRNHAIQLDQWWHMGCVWRHDLKAIVNVMYFSHAFYCCIIIRILPSTRHSSSTCEVLKRVHIMLNILNLPRGSYEILGFFVCFRALQYALKNYAPTPSGLKSSPPRKTWLYQNISVSFVHSFISAILSVYWWVHNPFTRILLPLKMSECHANLVQWRNSLLFVRDLCSFFDEPVMLTKMLTAWSNTAFYLVTFCTGMSYMGEIVK